MKLANIISALLIAALAPAAEAGDAVPFRGVVEGYYGRPWGTEENEGSELIDTVKLIQ